jgi:tetratricopeptide (TPR) repeat protein
MMISFRIVRAIAMGVALAIGALAPPASAGDTVLRGPAPAWVAPFPEAASDPVSTGDGMRLLLFDTQYRAGDGQQSYYVRSRSMAMTPQGLVALSNVGLIWSPANQDVTVHHLTLLRDGEVIDVLASQEFETFRREENLELATLDGRLTAVLQPSGLRVGDVLDFAYTIVSRDPVIGDRPALSIDLNLPVPVQHHRVRASWPSGVPVAVRAADDWTPLPVRRAGGYSSIEVVREDAQPVIVPDDAPLRLHAVNRVELSGYRDWAEVAAALKPLYDQARRLDPESPLRAEIARIRALSDDPAIQTAAALRLVQDQVRYVALLMGEGALTPATAEETWSRRFGDCKGKTVLLLALLDGLGIAAEPAAVSLQSGDGLDQQLPMIAAFDHVLVRAVVDGQVHWLDGTRMGDRKLEDIGVPPFHWALPLTAANATLEALEVAPLAVPTTETLIDIDASAGQHAPAAVTGSMIMRGESAAVLAGQLSLVSAAQRDQGLRSLWTTLVNDLAIDEAGSTYDPDENLLTLTMTGSATLGWRSDGLIPPGSTYMPLSAPERPEGRFHDAPYAVLHPAFSRQQVTVRLPYGGEGFSVSGGRFDRTELGHRLSRSVEIEGDTVTVEILQRSLVDEITASEAEEARTAAAARPVDYPRIVPPSNYRLTEADEAALAANQPTTGDEWLDRAFALSRSGDYPGALEAADRAVELSPENSGAWANRGVYRYWTGDLEGAAADLEKASDLDPSDRIAMNGHALLANSEGRYQDAVVEMSRALRQAPTDEFALGMRARAYLALGQHDRALRDLDALVAAHPGNLESQFLRISALDMADRRADAEAALDALVETRPTDPTMLLTAAAYRLDFGDAQTAFDSIDRLIADTPEADATLFLTRGQAAVALGRLDVAARDFQTVREARADDAMMLNNLCWTAAVAGVMLDAAQADCEAALALSPDSAAILDSKGRVLLQRGDAAGALAAYDAALAKAPELPASLYGRGLARLALGDPEAGEADKAAALAIYPAAAEDFENYAPPAGAAP